MRNPSPISISSPRETTTSRPSASAASASSTAAALLLTTSAASAPGQAAEQRREVVLARPALAPLEVVLEVRVAARRPRPPARARRRRAARARGSCARGRRSRSARVAATAGALARARRATASTSGAGSRARPDLLPRPLEHRPRRRDGELVRLGRPAARRASSSSTDGRSRSVHAESVGTSSRSERASASPAARGPDLEHRLVVDLLRQDAGGHVRHDRDPEARGSPCAAPR